MKTGGGVCEAIKYSGATRVKKAERVKGKSRIMNIFVVGYSLFPPLLSFPLLRSGICTVNDK